MACVDDVIDGAEHSCVVACGQCSNRGVNKRKVSDAEQWDGHLVAQPFLASAGKQLVQDGQGVTGGTAACANDEGEDGIIDAHAFGLARALQ